MKKWQENRNYRHIYDSDGNVTANIITADSQDVAVTEEVFLVYSQADRRERYIADEVEPGKLVSLEKLMEDHVPLERCGVSPVESAEEELIQLEEMELWMRRQRNLGAALSALSEREQELIHSLYYEGISTREYARKLGITQHAVIKRRDRVLRKMKKIFENLAD